MKAQWGLKSELQSFFNLGFRCDGVFNDTALSLYLRETDSIGLIIVQDVGWLVLRASLDK
jgi:hypothetical protein